MKEAPAAGKAALFERVPDAARLAWPDIAAILSGVVSSLSKLMGGGIVAFYAGCQLGGVAMAITFALSFVLTYLVGKITFREGLPNNVVSRLYIFGTKGSAAGSLVWIFLLVGVLAVGTVQLERGVDALGAVRGHIVRVGAHGALRHEGHRAHERRVRGGAVCRHGLRGVPRGRERPDGRCAHARGAHPRRGGGRGVRLRGELRHHDLGLAGALRGRLHALRAPRARPRAHLAGGQPLRRGHVPVRRAHHVLRLRAVGRVLLHDGLRRRGRGARGHHEPGRVARAGGRRGGARHHLPVADEGGDVELHRRRERGGPRPSSWPTP